MTTERQTIVYMTGILTDSDGNFIEKKYRYYTGPGRWSPDRKAAKPYTRNGAWRIAWRLTKDMNSAAHESGVYPLVYGRIAVGATVK
jgi:hypothetical protein